MDNMMFDIAQTISLSDEEFKQEIAKRRERLQLAEGQTVVGCPLCGYSKLEAATSGNQQP
jgi:hypothetical protein